MFMEIAEVISRRSSCLRGQVGAVIVLDNRIISTGYNGDHSKADECTAINCDLDNNCKRAIHAEQNAIYFASKHGIALDGSFLICTTMPCINCAKAIIQTGIVGVLWKNEYTDLAGHILLNEKGIQCTRIR